MKSLYDIILDECDCVTPGNTVGMGNPMMPTAEEPGTEPLPTQKKKKSKKIKESLLDELEDIESKQDMTSFHSNI